MTVTDPERTALYNELTDVLGMKEASKLMEHLPPAEWDQLATQLATKDDLTAFEERLGTRIDGTNARLDQTNQRLDGTNARLDETNERLDGTNVRIDQTNERLDQTNERLDATNVRIDTTNAYLAETNKHLVEIDRKLTGIDGRFTEIQGEFIALRGRFELTLAKHFRQTIFVLMGFTLAMWGPVVLMLAN